MSNKTKNKLEDEYSIVVDAYRADYRMYMPVSKADLLEQFNEYCEALCAIDVHTAAQIINYGKKWCEKWLHYQKTQNNMFYLIDRNWCEKSEFPMCVDDKRLQEVFFRETQRPEGVLDKYDDPAISVNASEHKKANKEWWNLQLNKHQLALDYLEAIHTKKRGVAEGKLKSNAEVLPEMRGWMDPLMRKIVCVDVVKNKSEDANELVRGILAKEYEGFEDEFNWNELKTPFVSGGKLTKRSIALALIFIMEKKEEGKTVHPDTIRKRYSRLNLW